MDNQRLFYLLLFGFSLVMLWDGWQKYTHPTVPAAQVSAPVTAPGADAVPAASGIPAPTAAAAPLPPTTPASAPTVTVTSDLVIAEISALGGDLVRLEMTQHRATEDRTHNFVLFEAKHAYAAQSGLIGTGLPNHKTMWQLPAEKLDMKAGENDLRVRLVAPTENGIEVGKSYIFHRGSYLVDVEYDIVNKGTTAVSPEAYFQLIRNGKPPEGSGGSGMTGVATFTGPAFYTNADKFMKVEFADVAKNKVKIPGTADNGWVAMVQHYFVSGWLPADGPSRQFYVEELGAGSDLFRAGVRFPVAAIAPGDSAKVTVPLYAGPQEQQKLAKVAPGFDLVVDYGWLTVIAAPIFWVLDWLNSFIGNWGWSIIVMTILIKLAFFPLSAASYKSMAKMRVLTPKMQKLKETYADDKERMNRELMELYRKEKVNPLGGCLPILVQIPVFIALYWVLLGTVEMRGAPWLGWITDLSIKDPYFILPLVMGVTMFVSNKLNPQPTDPMQAKIMMLMPIVFTGMFLFFPSGLVLYWTVNNLLSIAQQSQVNRMIAAGDSGKSSS